MILILAIPTGYLIAWMARDELVDGRKYFRWIILVSMLLAIGSLFRENYLMVYSFLFVAIVTFVSFIKSKDKNWTKK